MSSSPAHATATLRRPGVLRRVAPRVPLQPPAWRPALRPVSLAVCLLGAAPAAFALPTGAVLTGGQATVQQTAPGQMLIRQATPKAGLDWTSFSIAVGETVDVVQPGRSAVLLNRVVGDDPSLIYGALRSNGSVWLINPRGIVFGASARVDVGGLLASTLAIDGDALAGGRLQLGAGPGGAGELRSEGHITAIDGSVVLVAPRLLHSGQITARRVGLAAASEVLVDVEGDGLVFFNVRNDGLDTRLALLGGVRADGGSADIRAAARAGFADTVLNLEGVVQARGIGMREGRIVIDGGASGLTRVAGTLDASAGESGRDDVRGGSITVQGDRLQVEAGAQLDATGPAGGGQILLGGDYQGRNAAVRNATRTTVAPGALLDASATLAGDGGRIIVWSDDTTVFDGRAAVRGGSVGGDGGFIETSGKLRLGIAQGVVDLRAPAGRGGQWLLDPDNITVQTAGGTATYPGVNGETGDQTIAPDVLEAAGNAAPDAVITLAASQSITVNEPITFTAARSSLTLTGGGAGSITLNADIGTANGAITITSGTGGITQAANTSLASGTGTLTLDAGGGPVSLSGSLVNSSSAPNAIAITNASTLQVGNLGSGAAGTITLGHGGAGSQATGTAITTGSLVKQGGGTLTLDQTNTYTGSTTVQGGGLTLATTIASTNITVTGGTLATGVADLLDDTAAVTVAAGGTLTLGGADTIGTLTLGGELAVGGLLTAGNVTLTHGAAVNSGFNATTALSASGSVAINSAVTAASTTLTGGTLTLGGALASNSVNLGGGTLALAGNGLLGSAATVTVASGAALETGGTASIGTLVLGGTLSGASTLSTVTLNATVAGSTPLITGSVDVTGNATVGATAVLSLGNDSAGGAINVTGTTTVDGTLEVRRDSALNVVDVIGSGALAGSGTFRQAGSQPLTLDRDIGTSLTVAVAGGSTLNLDSARAVPTLNLSGTLTGAGLLTATTLNLLPGASVQAPVAGTALNATGNGTSTLAAASNYSTVDVANGATLRLDTGSNIADTTAVTVSSGGTLQLGVSDTVGALTIAGALAGSGTLTSTALTTLQDGAAVAAGTVIGGTAGGGLGQSSDTNRLFVTGSATLEGHSNHTRVDIGNGATLTLGNVVSPGGYLDDGATVNIASSGTLVLQVDEVVDRKKGSGTISGATLITSQTEIEDGETLGGNNTVNGLLISNGTARISGDVTVNGSVQVQSGTLTVGATNGNSGSLSATGSTTVSGGATLAYFRDNVSSITLGGSYVGAGTFRNDGTAAILVGGTLGTASVSLAGGSLTLLTGATDRLADAAVVTVASSRTLTLDNASETIGSLNLAGTLAGTGTLTASTAAGGTGLAALSGATVSSPLIAAALSVSGVTALNGAVTATTTTLTGGTLTLGNVLAPGTLTVQGGAALTLTSGGSLSGLPAVIIATGGTLTLPANTSTSVGSLSAGGTLASGGAPTPTLFSAGGYTLTTGAQIGVNLGAGTLAVNGNATLNGSTLASTVAIDGGTLTLGSAGRLANTPTVNIAATAGSGLTLGGNETVAGLSSAGTLAGGTNRLTSTGGATLQAGAVVDAELGSVSLNVDGNAALNRLATATTVHVNNGATLTTGTAEVLADVADVAVSAGGTLALGGNERVGTLTLNGTLSGSGRTLTASTTLLQGSTTVDANLGIGSLVISNGASANLAGSAASATVDIQAGGQLTLVGANRLNASPAVQLDGALVLGGAATLGSLAGSGTGNLGSHTLSTGGGGDTSFGGMLSGSGGNLTKLGNTTFTLTASQTYTGTTTVSAGTLRLSGSERLADGSSVEVGTSGTLALGGGTSTETVNNLTLAGTLTGSGTLVAASTTLDGGSTASTAALVAGQLVSIGSSTLNGSFAGDLRVTGGQLTLTSGGRLTKPDAWVEVQAGTLVLGGDETVGSLTLAGTLDGGGRLIAPTHTLQAGATVNAHLGGGTVTVTGDATLAGNAQVTAVAVDNGATLTVSAAPGLIDDSAAVTLAAGGQMVLGGDETVGSLTLAGTLGGAGRKLTAATYTLEPGAQVLADLGAGTLRVVGTGTLGGSGNSTLSGNADAASVFVDGGTLVLGSANRLAPNAIVTVATPATLQVGGDESLRQLNLAGTLAGASSTLTADASIGYVLNGGTVNVPLGSGAMSVIGASVLNATAAVDSVDVAVGGTLTLGAGGLFSASPLVSVAATGTVALGSDQTFGALGGSGSVALGSHTLRTGSASSSFDGVLSGSGGLVKQGGGSFNLGGSQAYLGATQVIEGTLALQAADVLPDTSAVTVGSGATLALAGADRVGSLTLAGTLAGSGTLSAPSTTLLPGGATGVNANLGAGTLTVMGNSTLAGSSAAGVINVDSGTLTLASADRLADTATVTVAPGTGNGLALNGNDTVGSLTLAGSLAGVGHTLTAGVGAITLQAGATVSADLGPGTLNVNGNATLSGTAAAGTVNVGAGRFTLTGAGRLAAGAEVLVRSAAELLLGGDENVGTLRLAGTLGGAPARLSAATYTLEPGARVVADLGTGTLRVVGTLASTLGGSGDSLLTGAAGATIVNVEGGTLALGAAERLADNAAVTVAAGATLRLGGAEKVGSLALSGTLEGSSTLSASSYLLNGGTYNAPLGEGELTSTGNTFLNATSAAGVVTVSGGTLTLGAPLRFIASPAPALTVAGGATLILGGDETVGTLAGAGTVGLGSFTLTSAGTADAAFSGSLTGSGGFTKQGSTTFTLGGNNPYTGSTRVAAGTLAVTGTLASLDLQVAGGTLALGAADRLADGAVVTVTSGALFTLSGDERIQALSLAGRLAGSGTLAADSVALDSGLVDANLGGGSLTSNGSSQLNGTSAATQLTVAGDTLTLAGGGRLTAAPNTTVASGATLALQGATALGSLAGAGNVTLGSHTLTTGSRASSQFDGVLSGTGGLRKNGIGTNFTLAGANTYAGATYVVEGTLATAGADRLPNGTAIDVATGATLTLGGSDTVASLVLAGTLGGSGTLQAASVSLDGGTVNSELGTGTFSSTGASRLAAASAATTVTVNGGTLTLAAGNLLADTATVTVASSATLALGGDDRVTSLNLAGTLGGSGTLTADSYAMTSGRVAIDAKLGRGALTSNGTSELVGSAEADTVAVIGGTLSLASAGRLVGSPVVTVATGATLTLGGNQTATSLALAGTLDGNGTLDAPTVTLSSGQVLADLGGGTLGSSGNSTLAGRAAATALNVDGGTLALASAGRLSGAPSVTVASGATLALGGDQTLGALAGAGQVDLGGGAGGSGATLTTGSRGDSRYDGVLSGTGALAKVGSTTLTLGGANLYTGTTTVREGTLATAAAGVLPDASAVTVDSGARLQLGGDDTVASLLLAGTLDGSATLAAATTTLQGGSVNAHLGGGRLVSRGHSLLAGSSASDEVVVEGDTLELASANRLADTASLRVDSGATLRITGDDTVASAQIAGTLTGTGTFSAANISLDGGQVHAALGGGALSSTGSSLLNATSLADSLAVVGGTLTLGAGQRLLATPAVTLTLGAALVLGGDETIGTLAGSGNLNLGAATLRSGIDGDSSYAGVMAGNGGFVKQGSGSFTLAADQAYTGTTTVTGGTLALAGTLATQAVQVNTGTLALAAPERLPDTSPVAVANGARLTLAGDEHVASLALAGTLAGSGRLSAASYTLNAGTVDADLGSGGLQSTGASRLNGSAAVDTVAVNGDTLTLGSADRLSALPAVTVAGGATLQLAGSQTVGTLAGAGTVGLADHTLTSAGLSDTTFSGSVEGSGGLTKQGSTVLTLDGMNGYTGTTRIEGGTLAITGTLASRDVQVVAGTLALTGNERLADIARVAVAGGALMSMAGIETIGSLTLAGTLTGTGGLVAASYALNGGTASVDNLGSGVLRSSGSSTLNSASAAGTLLVDDGTLTLGAGSHFTAAPAVTVAGGATLTLGGAETFGTLAGAGLVALANHTLSTGSGGSSSFAGVLDGSGELVKQGSTTFTLGGNSTATGDTRILAGTLQVDGTLASTALVVGTDATLALTAPERLPDTAFVNVLPRATFTLAGNETVASLLLAGTLAGSGTLSAATYSLDGGTANTELGTGTLTAAGNSRLAAAAAAGSVAVTGGTLTLAAGNLLADTAAVTVSSAATLALDATDSVASLALAGTLAGSGTLSAASYALDSGTANANLGTGTLSSRGNSVLAGSAAVGSVTVQTGTLTLAAPQRPSATPAVQLDTGGTLALLGDQTFGTLSGSGTLALGSFTLATGGGGDSSFAGVLAGSGGLIKQGSISVFTLTGASTYTGATLIEAGTLRLGNGLNDGSPGATGGSLATGNFQVDGLLELARADDTVLPQPVAGSGGVRQAGSGRLMFSGNNKTYTGDTTVARGELATAGADEVPDGSAVIVAADGRLSLGGRETLRSIDADGSVALAGDLAASGDLLLRGAVATAGPLQLSGERIEAVNAGNRLGGALALDARGAVALAAGAELGGAARDLVLGNVRVADGGRIEAGRLTLGSETTVGGGTLQLVATAQPGGIAPDATLAGRQATALPIAWAEDTVLADVGSRIGVAAGAALDIVASGGGAVRLLDAGNNFAGSLSVVSGAPDTPWSVNATALAFGGGAAQNVALQSRVQVHGLTVNVGGVGIVADVVNIRADRLATASPGATLVARLPYDSAAGTASQLPGLTLELTPEAYNQSFPFGAPGADGGLRVNVGSRAYGNRTLPLDAGYVTVLPRDGARGTTAVLLLGPTVNPAGGYRFFFDGAGRQSEIPVFYNGVLPTTPQVENSLSAAVAVSEGARKERFDEAVRTENVAVRLRAGVIAEVGPAPSATQGTEGLRVPTTCPPLGTTLGCAKAP